MKLIKTALGIGSFLALASGTSMIPSIASADTVERTYVACNQDGDCWRVHQRYSYPSDQRIVFHDGEWYTAHQSDEHVHWLSDPADDHGWYERGGRWHSDPGVRAIKGGTAGAAVGAAIGCVVTLPAGCAPGAAAGAAIGGGTGAVAGAASTPHD